MALDCLSKPKARGKNLAMYQSLAVVPGPLLEDAVFQRQWLKNQKVRTSNGIPQLFSHLDISRMSRLINAHELFSSWSEDQQKGPSILRNTTAYRLFK